LPAAPHQRWPGTGPPLLLPCRDRTVGLVQKGLPGGRHPRRPL